MIKRILVDPDNALDLLYFLAFLLLGYKPNSLCSLGRVLVGFNGSQTSSLREIVLLVSTGLVITLVSLMVIDEPSSFNTILGCTWIHAVKALPSLYHKVLSFLTPLGQVNIRGDQEAVKACCEVKQQEGTMPTK